MNASILQRQQLPRVRESPFASSLLSGSEKSPAVKTTNEDGATDRHALEGVVVTSSQPPAQPVRQSSRGFTSQMPFKMQTAEPCPMWVH